MKLLSIGNSFSMDAHRWLHQIAQSYGDEIHAVNLYIGGCSLERHYNNLLSGEQAYEAWINGQFSAKSSIQEALLSEKWDIITLQQVSQFSGMPETYEPFLKSIYTAVKEACPESTILFHQTWAYEQGADHPGFVNYNNNQEEMHRKVHDTVAEIAAQYGCAVIPTGDTIQYLRANIPEFDCANGGMSLNCDGYHLTHIYGRYAAALTWYCVLTGKLPEAVRFLPETEGETADPLLLQKIHEAVKEVLA